MTLSSYAPQLQNCMSPTRKGPASFRASFMAWGLVEMTSSLILQTTWRH
ncbi:hypothetical protein GQ600_11430 [Phytophthora cactorum]|nr:hypothetical protein GQ600_11430 [Phytophthora cactorum]